MVMGICLSIFIPIKTKTTLYKWSVVYKN